MNNMITNWSWERPVEEGIYLVCYGDVETPYNIYYLHLIFDEAGDLRDRETGKNVDEYTSSYKFAALFTNEESYEEAQIKYDEECL